MKHIKLTARLLLVSLLIISCSNDDSLTNSNDSFVIEGANDKIKDYLLEKGFIDDTEKVQVKADDVFVDDVVFSKEYLTKLIDKETGDTQKALVYADPHKMDYANASTIVVNNMIPKSLPLWREALTRAIGKWNDSNLCSNIHISYGNQYANNRIDVIIDHPWMFENPATTIADARTPQYGKVGSRIRINSQNFNSANATIQGMTNTLVHEIGHTIGLAHNMSSENDGYITSQIPGTSNGDSWFENFDSVMYFAQDSFTYETTSFSHDDILAIRALFPSLSMSKMQFNLANNIDQITTGDYNGNGKNEIAAYTPGQQRINFYNIEGNGFESTSNSNAGIAGYNIADSRDKIISFDYNGDGKDDLCLYRPGTGIAFIAKSNGDETFTNVVSSFSGLSGFDLLSVHDKIIPFDYNGDGKDDLCLYRPGAGILFIAKSNGNGTFTNVVVSLWGFSGYDLRSIHDKVLALDYNGDGKDDLCLYRPGAGILFIAKSNGNATFTNVIVSPWGFSGYDLRSVNDIAVALDYNGDGKDDLCLYRPGAGIIFVIKSNGNATFTNETISATGIAGFNIADPRDRINAFDYDGDGKEDLCLTRAGNKVIYIGKSNGDGTFTNLIASHVGIASDYTGDCIN